MYRVFIKGKDFNVRVLDDNNNEMKFDVNVAMFDDKNFELEKLMVLSWIESFNKNSNNYLVNTIMAITQYTKIPYPRFNFDLQMGIKNEMNGYSFTNIPPKEKIDNYAKKLIEIAKKNKYEVIYEVETYNQIILACILHFSFLGYTVQRCLNCNKWLIPKTLKNTKFCYRYDEELNTMQCNDAYKYKQRLLREHNIESVKLSKNIYNSLRLKYDRTDDGNIKEKEQAKKVLDEFMKLNKEKRDLFKSGKIKESQYIEWLNTYRKGGGKNGKGRVHRNT